MRRHAKASTAGSTQRQAAGFGRFFRRGAEAPGSSPGAPGSGARSRRPAILAIGVFLLVLAFGATLAAAASPVVVTEPVTANTGVRATLNGKVNPEGEELTECKFEWGKGGAFDQVAPCAESNATIGSGTSPVSVHADVTGLAPQGTEYRFRLVAKNATSAAVTGGYLSFSTAITVVATAASGITPTTLTLNGTVNPDTATISECQFEWGLPKEEGEASQKYPNAAPCTPGPGSIAGAAPVPVSANISGLHAGTSYVYRLKATYPTGPAVSSTLTAQTAGPRVVGAWAQDVTRVGATLKAQIDPEGSATTYRFEYGTTGAYGSQTPELVVGSDSTVDTVSRYLGGLNPDTTYHFRLVSTRGAVENVGPDQTFTTFPPFAPKTDCSNQPYRIGSALTLPDCRAYEMVSPIDKGGADILTIPTIPGYLPELDQSSLTGEKITYSSAQAFGDAAGSYYSNQYVATRSAAGWTTHGISPAETYSLGSPSYYELDMQYAAFTPDVSMGILSSEAATPLTPDAPAGMKNFFKRDFGTGAYTSLLTEVPLSGLLAPGLNANFYSTLAGMTPDGSHVILNTPAKLTPDAHGMSGQGSITTQLYDFHDGALELASVLPNGTAAPGGSGLGSDTTGTSVGGLRDGDVANAISDDGSRIFWSEEGVPNKRIFVRVDGEETIPISESVSGNSATYELASTDGSTVLFRMSDQGASEDRLYEFDVDTETPTLIAADSRGILNAADDLSYIYFVSTDVLDDGATAGEQNLYLRRNGVNEFVATLWGKDVGVPNPGWFGLHPSNLFDNPLERRARVTADGHVLVFTSWGRLTGYDNTATNSGEPASEVYRYDADTNQLTCLSCNPSGARPFAGRMPRPDFSRNGTSNVIYGGSHTIAWAGGFLNGGQNQMYGSHTMTADGNRVFFNAYDRLVPQDTNGQQDVYEWEAQGSGDCNQSGGCVSLISSGQSGQYSEFVDAGSDGRDVFFKTEESLDPSDPGLIDIYDARAGGGLTLPRATSPCVGDSCRNIPAAPPAASPASASYRGPGSPKARRHVPRRCRKAHRRRHKAHGRRHKAGKSAKAKRCKARGHRRSR